MRECEKASGAWRPQPWSSSLARPKFPITRQENTLGWAIKEFRGFEAFFDRDARRSGPTIHLVVDKTLVQNLLQGVSY